MPAIQLLQTYARRIRDLRRVNPEVSEPALAPTFQQLLEGVLTLLPIAPGLRVVPEFRNAGVGRPDIALMRAGAPPRAFVELKAPSKPADPTRWRGQDKAQYERFKELPCWSTCNFIDFRLLYRDQQHAVANVVQERWLRPDSDDRRIDREIAAHDPTPFLHAIETLFLAAGQHPIARDAEELATLMAHSARLVRGIVRDRLAELRVQNIERHALLQVRQEFRDVLYVHPEAAGYNPRDFDALFSAAFAQTLAFGLLLVREATALPVGPNAWEQMPEEHPLMRTALRVLSLPEVVADVGVGFDVMMDTVNTFTTNILAIRPDRRDPILYFYEDFLKTFDPEQRERFGVYYTPVQVVEYMVGALDRALRENLRAQGLGDPNVTILDPAVGTGTFLLGIAQRVREGELAAGPGMVALALQNLAQRMFGFELLVGPYAVAHYRLHHSLREQDGGEPWRFPRLGVYLTDTLARPNAAAPLGPLGFVSEGIAAEHREANRIKSRQEILAIIGNPPYRRLERGENRTLVGDWMDDLWDDLKEAVRNAGQGNQLNTFPELSVAFWRWAIWKLFESENAPGRGVVAFISNRKFLTGWPYAGLRQMMRQRFDRIEIFDLRGDVRTGERGDVEADQGVFNIKVGTAITLAIADGSKHRGEAARVLYTDSWTDGLYSRNQKFTRLRQRATLGTMPSAVEVRRGPLEAMRPEPFREPHWVALRELFVFSKSGMKSGNDDVFTSVQRSRLHELVSAFLGERADAQYQPELETFYAYRPLDRRWFYNELRLLNRPGPEMQRAWGANNVGLYAMPSGTGAGPAVWCHALLPDYHSLSGRGGYAFPLYDRREAEISNVRAELVLALSGVYGRGVEPSDVFDAILCILSAWSYTRRFAADLEDTFPHVAFPSQFDVFEDAARIGREIRQVETFAREPRGAFARPDFVRLDNLPNGPLAAVDFVGASLDLCEGGGGHITGLPPSVWNFTISGYPVLSKWLDGRVGMIADLGLVRELRDICGRIAELIDLFTEADTVLEVVLRDSLSREALGLSREFVEADVQPD
jgi:hypothetical protein